ncbi:recombinase family protein [Klebsiella pneumoniae]
MDAIPVTELSRWGRSTLDLLNTLRELENWKVSVIAMNGMAFDLSSPYVWTNAGDVSFRHCGV